jgi:hypothetical protein
MDSTVQVQIEEGLAAFILQHTILDDIECWTFLSQGLVNYGQKEVAFTVKKTSNQYPEDALRWYSLLLSFAKQQRTVDSYDITEFRSASFLGHSDIRMILYMPHQVFSGLTLAQQALFPQSHLHAIPLTSHEYQVYKEDGVLRVLTNLARATRYYPFPPWFDPTRPSLVHSNEFTGSIMKLVPSYRIPGTSAFFSQTSGDITLTVTPRAYRGNHMKEIESTPPEAAVGLQLELDDRLAGCLVWRAGQKAPNAVSTGGEQKDGPVRNGTFGLCNLVFYPQQDKVTFKPVEDGYIGG